MNYEKKYKEAIERLKQWDKEHPLGYSIQERDEFIFPELKESEDERIRKALMQNLKERFGTKGNMGEGLDMPKVLAWLEKQGEQKPADKVEPKFKVGDIVKHKDNPYLTYILKKFTDDGDYEFHAIGKDGNEGCTHFAAVKCQDDWELVEHSAWSEEDKKMIDTIIETIKISIEDCDVDDVGTKARFSLEKERDWLKNLKDRVQPQPQQQWNEEDECCRNQLITFCENCMVPDSNSKKCADWLKSIKDRYTWKPSDEQLNSLYDVLYPCDGFNRKVLESLYQDLKKLREE